MSYHYVVVIFILFFGGLAYFMCDEIVNAVSEYLFYAYPYYYSGEWVGFYIAVHRYMPFVVILLSALIYSYVQSQTPGPGER